MDSVGYLKSGHVVLPENAPFTNDFIAECEAFAADDTRYVAERVGSSASVDLAFSACVRVPQASITCSSVHVGKRLSVGNHCAIAEVQLYQPLLSIPVY